MAKKKNKIDKEYITLKINNCDILISNAISDAMKEVYISYKKFWTDKLPDYKSPEELIIIDAERLQKEEGILAIEERKREIVEKRKATIERKKIEADEKKSELSRKRAELAALEKSMGINDIPDEVSLDEELFESDDPEFKEETE